MQNKHVDEALVPALELQAGAHSEPDCAIEEVKQTLGCAVGRPDGNGKKKKSINLLCGVKLVKEKKTRGKKSQKK